MTFVGDFDELRSLITRRFRELAACDAALFCEFQPHRSAYTPTSTDPGGPGENPGIAIRVDGTLAKWLRINEETLEIPDTRGVSAFLDEDERDQLERHRVRACVPLVSVNRLVGVVLLTSGDRNWRLDPSEIIFLTTCGRQAGLVCEAVGRHGRELEKLRSMQRAQQLAVAGQLAAAVAHEIRNPLTAIRSSIQYVLSTPNGGDRNQELLESVLSEVDRISQTIAGILSLSRTQALERSDIDLVGVVEEALKLVEAVAETQSTVIIRRLDTRPLIVHGDERELRQVFVNLLFNACQALENGGEIITRSFPTTRSDGGVSNAFAVIDVADSGPGMNAEVLARVFDPFFTTRKSGTGLGLPICLEIVNRHGGEISLSSEPGHGTVATVMLPLRSVS